MTSIIHSHPSHKESGTLMDYAGTLAQIAEVSAQTSGDQHAMERILEETAALFNTDRAALFRFSQNGHLKQMASLDLPRQSVHSLEEVSNANHIKALLDKSGRPVIIQQAKKSREEVGAWANLLNIETVALAPLQSNGTTVGTFVLCHKLPYNYTAEKSALLQVISALTTPLFIRTAQSDSEDASAYKSQLFSVLSHELRTPLTSIMGFTQLIRKRLSASAHADRRTIEQLDVLWAQAQRLNRLIDTFVDMNRIERGEFEITRGQVELTSLLKTTAEQTLTQAGSQHEMIMDIPDHSLWIHGDSKRLEQVFSHVLANALKYAPREKPILMSCNAKPGEGIVTVNVVDRGPGIPPARLKEIFDRNYSGGPLKSGGLGVGLYLSKIIVEAHGGRISIESSSAKGTVVEVVLPA